MYRCGEKGTLVSGTYIYMHGRVDIDNGNKNLIPIISLHRLRAQAAKRNSCLRCIYIYMYITTPVAQAAAAGPHGYGTPVYICIYIYIPRSAQDASMKAQAAAAGPQE